MSALTPSVPLHGDTAASDRGGTYIDRIFRRQAIKWIGAPANSVGLVAILTSDQAEFIAGQSTYADGVLRFT